MERPSLDSAHQLAADKLERLVPHSPSAYHLDLSHSFHRPLPCGVWHILGRMRRRKVQAQPRWLFIVFICLLDTTANTSRTGSPLPTFLTYQYIRLHALREAILAHRQANGSHRRGGQIHADQLAALERRRYVHQREKSVTISLRTRTRTCAGRAKPAAELIGTLPLDPGLRRAARPNPCDRLGRVDQHQHQRLRPPTAQAEAACVQISLLAAKCQPQPRFQFRRSFLSRGRFRPAPATPPDFCSGFIHTLRGASPAPPFPSTFAPASIVPDSAATARSLPGNRAPPRHPDNSRPANRTAPPLRDRPRGKLSTARRTCSMVSRRVRSLQQIVIARAVFYHRLFGCAILLQPPQHQFRAIP